MAPRSLPVIGNDWRKRAVATVDHRDTPAVRDRRTGLRGEFE